MAHNIATPGSAKDWFSVNGGAMVGVSEGGVVITFILIESRASVRENQFPKYTA